MNFKSKTSKLHFRLKYHFALVTAVFASCSSRTTSQSDVTIIGGTTNVSDTPIGRSTVGLATGNATEQTPFCSGTLISQNLVVTAAHCLLNFEKGEPQRDLFKDSEIFVYFTNPKNLKQKQFRKVSEWKVFRDLKDSTLTPPFDIAWVKFDSSEGPAPFGHVPAEIFGGSEILKPGVPIQMGGYGFTSDDKSDIDGLKRVVSSKILKDKFSVNFPGLFSYGLTPGKSTCNGDSGGSAFASLNGKNFLIGATYGTDLQIRKTPDFECSDGTALFTFVGAYKKWIAETAHVDLGTFDEKIQILPQWGNDEANRPFHQQCLSTLKTPGLFYFVKLVQKSLHTLDCAESAKRLSEVTSLNFQMEKSLAASTIRIDAAWFLQLPQLKELVISEIELVNTEMLSKLSNLESLFLVSNGITKINELNLPKLKSFASEINFLDTFDASGMPNLTQLFLERSNLSSLLGLNKLKNLEDLRISANRLKGILNLSSNSKLKSISLDENELDDVVLAAGSKFERVDLTHNHIKSLDFLKQTSKVGTLLLFDTQNQKFRCPSNVTNCEFGPSPDFKQTKYFQKVTITADTIASYINENPDLLKTEYTCQLKAGTQVDSYQLLPQGDKIFLSLSNPLPNCPTSLRGGFYVKASHTKSLSTRNP